MGLATLVKLSRIDVGYRNGLLAGINKSVFWEDSIKLQIKLLFKGINQKHSAPLRKLLLLFLSDFFYLMECSAIDKNIKLLSLYQIINEW